MASRCGAAPARMGRRMEHRLWRLRLAKAATGMGTTIALACAAGPASAQKTPVENSGLDAPLFYQLLIGEMEAAAGRSSQAVEFMVDAARRTRNEALFERAAEMAIQARSGDQALAVIRSWRSTLPQSRLAVQLQLQVLFALGRPDESTEPLRSLLSSTPAEQRSAVIAAIPKLFERTGDTKAALVTIEQVLQPYLQASETRTAARVALARATLEAGDPARAIDLLRSAQSDDPAAPDTALAALELIDRHPEAEALVTNYVARPDAEPAVRLAYARALTSAQRLTDAAAQMRIVVAKDPGNAAAWLGLGAYGIELRELDEADSALRRYLALKAAQATPAPNAAAPTAPAPLPVPAPAPEGGEQPDSGPRDPVQAWMMLAQVAEMRGDLRGAQAWLDKVQPDDIDFTVITRKAHVMARQGQLDKARQLIVQAPEREKDDAREKLLAEATLLREFNQTPQAYAVLARAGERFADDVAVLYETAMTAEKLNKVDEMERLLRKVIELKPDHAHAHNALGYSLVDRNMRLPEARDLIQRALELSPGDPFIVDSLGWAEFRLGNRDAALTLLRRAYASRPDTEIGAHLGEALWANGQRDEARQVWRQAQVRDRENEVLKQTLKRLKVGNL
jgi:tetratricopeptide (TPR) repeat protein